MMSRTAVVTSCDARDPGTIVADGTTEVSVAVAKAGQGNKTGAGCCCSDLEVGGGGVGVGIGADELRLLKGTARGVRVKRDGGWNRCCCWCSLERKRGRGWVVNGAGIGVELGTGPEVRVGGTGIRP